MKKIKRNQLLALCALVILVLTVFACENPFIPGKYKEPAPPQAPSISVEATPIGPYVKGEGVTMTAKASVGDAGELSYQWYSNTKNSNSGGTKISGATGESYRPSTDVSAENILEPSISYYYVEATNTLYGRTTSAVSRAVDVAVFDIPAGTTAIREVALTVITPVKGAEPSEVVATEAGYSLVEMEWDPWPRVFQERYQYKVIVKIQAEPNHTLIALRSATINGHTAEIKKINGNMVELSYKFAEMKSVDAMAVKTQPTNLTYTHGDALNLSGLVLTLTFNDGTTEDVEAAHFAERDITTNPADGSALSHTNHNGKPIVVSHTGVTVNTNNLTVNKAEITTIDVNKIIVVSPSTAETPDPNATVDSLENYTSGAVSWTVNGTPVTSNFGGNTQYTATVTLTAGADYLFANTLTAHINNGAAAVTNNNGTNVTLSHTFSATTPAAVTGISIKTQPATLSGYIHGDELNLAGLVVTVHYVSGTDPEDVTLGDLASRNISTNPADGEVLLRSRDNNKPVVVSMGGRSANTTGTLNIDQKAVTVTGAFHTKTYDGTNAASSVSSVTGLTFNGNISGEAISYDTVTAVYTSTNAGTKTINITALPLTGNADINYAVTLPVDVTLTGIGNIGIMPATSTVSTLPTAANINYGAALSTSALTPTSGSGTGVNGENVPGTFAWTNPGAVPGGGISNASVTFTPTSANYIAIARNISITVNPQITFVLNGGTLNSSTNNYITHVTYNSAVTKPTNPTRSSYTFDSWYTETAFTTPYYFGTILTDNITLYAKWALTSDITTVTNVTNSATGMAMVFRSGGDFGMGRNSVLHDVTLKSFYIGKYEVTQEQYQSVMNKNPSYFQGSYVPPMM